jgi:hypothetical protein
MSGFRVGRKFAQHFYPDNFPRGGPTGPAGAGGPAGPTGPTGPAAGGLVADFANFYVLTPPTIVIASGAVIPFSVDGPAGAGAITRVGATNTFMLNTTGIYEVTWQSDFVEAGQTSLALGAGLVPILRTVVGRATGTTQMFGSVLYAGTAGDILSVINVADTSLTIPPPDGSSTHGISATLTFKLLEA